MYLLFIYVLTFYVCTLLCMHSLSQTQYLLIPQHLLDQSISLFWALVQNMIYLTKLLFKILGSYLSVIRPRNTHAINKENTFSRLNSVRQRVHEQNCLYIVFQLLTGILSLQYTLRLLSKWYTICYIIKWSLPFHAT